MYSLLLLCLAVQVGKKMPKVQALSSGNFYVVEYTEKHSNVISVHAFLKLLRRQPPFFFNLLMKNLFTLEIGRVSCRPREFGIKGEKTTNFFLVFCKFFVTNHDFVSFLVCKRKL